MEFSVFSFLLLPSHNRAEAKRVSIYEYDEERHMRQTRAEGYEEGEMIATARINQLNLILIEQNRTSDIAKAAAAPDYQKKLLDELSL